MKTSKSPTLVDAILETLDKIDTTQWEYYLKPSIKEDFLPYNPISDSFYTGFNKTNLMILQMFSIYSSNKYATYKQIKEIGGKLKKGAKHVKIFRITPFYTSKITGKSISVGKWEKLSKKNQDNYERCVRRKYFQVFNFQFIENLEELDITYNSTEIIFNQSDIESFLNNSGAEIKVIENTKNAYYELNNDFIATPHQRHYKSEEMYYATLLHELIHWTGHENRLSRLSTKDIKNKESYAFEELIAEIGSLLLYTQFDTYTQFQSSVAYLKGYLQYFKKEEKETLNRAYEKSRKAERFLNELQLIKQVA